MPYTMIQLAEIAAESVRSKAGSRIHIKRYRKDIDDVDSFIDAVKELTPYVVRMTSVRPRRLEEICEFFYLDSGNRFVMSALEWVAKLFCEEVTAMNQEKGIRTPGFWRLKDDYCIWSH